MLRDGQWVLFDDLGFYAGCQRSRDGRAVGIYQGAFAGDANAAPHAAMISVVAPDGTNFEIKVDGHIMAVRLHPNQKHLEPVTCSEDVPYARIKDTPRNCWPPEWKS